tara:strand:- start:21726 stop:23306 length:1581 start_codon:yes stop_codon:yes gene_type:complete
MAIKRFYATKDTTITNAYKANLTTRGTGSNMGEADTLEIFSIYAQANTSSHEMSRALIDFNVDAITNARASGSIPASGSVEFYLKMHNAKHSYTTPRKYWIDIIPISQSWEEGYGLDMDEYTDKGEANWIKASNSVTWSGEGGDYLTGSEWYPTASAYFERGYENLDVRISHIVERWLKKDKYFLNYGLGIKLSGTYETGSTNSYYTKKFFARSTEYFFKRPCIEARWDTSTKDQRGDTYFSSSLMTGPDNLNTIYLYNYVRGQLKNIPGVLSGALNVQIFSGTLENTAPSGSAIELVVDNKYVLAGVGNRTNTVITGGFVSTGIYSASFAITASKTPLTHIFDVWYTGSKAKSAEQAGGNRNYFTGVIKPRRIETSMINPTPRYTTKITNLKPSYHPDEIAKLRLYVRDKDWNPNIYMVATKELDTKTIEDAYYKVIREADNLLAIPYGTGSGPHLGDGGSPDVHNDDPRFTRLSYDVSGNYFDLDMSLLEPGYMYKIKLLYDINGSLREQKEAFKFRVDKHDSE